MAPTHYIDLFQNALLKTRRFFYGMEEAEHFLTLFERASGTIAQGWSISAIFEI